MSRLVNRKRKISTAMISTPSMISSASSASTQSRIFRASFLAAYVSQESDEIEIPANLQSAETYKFVGATYGLRKDYGIGI